ncbi:MAG: phosphotransferase family protein [Deltaproteobacteria bacterium]|nr:phosphotransferase family protein [Deltaproteobacteria bacterium]
MDSGNVRALRERLERVLARELGAASVRSVARARSTEGFSQDTFRFDAEVARAGARGVERWVAKREPVAGLLEPYDLEPEFRVLHALSEDPFPSPPTPWFTRDPAVLERPFYVMRCLPGEVPIPAPSADGSGPFADDERRALGPEVARTLAALHAVDWRARGLGFLGDPGPGPAAAARELARWEARIRASGLPTEPALAAALVWLRAHVPSCDETTLVHGDYRLGNFLVERAGARSRLTGILDWEMVHLGDPLEDLAWCASPLWRAGTELASGLLLPDELAAVYATAAGRAVDPARLRFYDVLTLVKMIAIMQTGIRAFNDGRTHDLRMAIFDHQLPFLLLILAMTLDFFGGGAD